ncbi:MAG TPA: cytochrome b [Burkholderiales bacterium]|nr:cytochrome b [Burkholderiales bacterium]
MVAKYPSSAVAWHWILAALVFVLYGMGWYMVEIPKGTPPVAFWYNLHKSIGIVSAIPVAWLLAWRLRNPPPPLPATMPRWEIQASHLSHTLFYICLIVLVVSGFIESNFTKWGIKFFGVEIPPFFSEDKGLYYFFNRIHVYTSYLFTALIAIHIVAALKHWLVDRDQVFHRMLPGKES